MLRRKPTRLELKLDDMEEYETLRKAREQERRLQGLDTPTPDLEQGKTKREIIHERIGYDPKPLLQPVRLFFPRGSSPATASDSVVERASGAGPDAGAGGGAGAGTSARAGVLVAAAAGPGPGGGVNQNEDNSRSQSHQNQYFN